MTDLTDARHLVRQARERKEAGDTAGAESAYLAAVQASPEWFVPLYNLGLLYKYQGRWKESLELYRRAVVLAPGDEDAWWNLGIAATAVGDWHEARRAWSACGMQPPAGDGPPNYHFGSVPVRLDPTGRGEVVWAERMDPARARLENIPLPWSDYNWGDVVLHDGAAEGYRVVDGTQYPVFNALALLIPSGATKYVVELATSDRGAVDTLLSVASSMGGAAEDWGSSTRILCRECSLGVAHDHPERDPSPAHPHCGLAARDDAHAQSVIDAWLSSHPGADLVRWYAA